MSPKLAFSISFNSSDLLTYINLIIRSSSFLRIDTDSKLDTEFITFITSNYSILSSLSVICLAPLTIYSLYIFATQYFAVTIYTQLITCFSFVANSLTNNNFGLFMVHFWKRLTNLAKYFNKNNISTGLANYFCDEKLKQQIKDLVKMKNFNVLLTGHPGVGKTFLMKCLAEELERPLIYHSGSFVNTYVGSGVNLITKLFNEALACKGILVLDELHLIFDSSSSGVYFESETEATLLYFLEDPKYKNNIIVALIANNVTDIHPALYRAGRVDRLSIKKNFA
jgi:hypothetical protein